jgi:cytochrome P450
MKKNDKIWLLLIGANLDPRRFSDPEKVDIDRDDKAHIAFNAGPHRCLGSHLARLELRVLYEELLTRLPAFRLDPGNPPTFHCGYVVGVDTLHLEWDTQ